MRPPLLSAPALVLAALAAGLLGAPREDARAQSAATDPPMRPLPAATDRPLPASSADLRFVDPRGGDDAGPGTAAAPWRTLRRALDAAAPGLTLVLRGGVYHGRHVLKARGTPDRPITVRSHPGELAILDGGFPEFLEAPQTAWEPVPDGAGGEFRSVRSYREAVLGGPGTADGGDGDAEGTVHLMGHFAESMIPLHGYRFLSDLRSANEYFAALDGAKTEESRRVGIFCGPGLWFDAASGRIHARLAHTSQTCLEPGGNYAGETDPRRVPLVVTGGPEAPLRLEEAAHVILQDLVVRGARGGAIEAIDCANLTLDGVTAYGGASALRVESTSGLRCVDCAFRGAAAPWTWRGSLKYRSIEARIVSASAWQASARPNRDFEFAWCEFTDCVDGVFVGGVDGVDIHHSLLDHVSDDGLFATAGTAYDGTTAGGPLHVRESLLSRCLTTFAFGVGHGRQKVIGENGRSQLGDGIWIYRNVFDFRRPVFYQQPPAGQREILTYGRTCGDHGSPGWEPMTVYHNTILAAEAPWRNSYAAGWGGGMGKGTRRALFNNVFFHVAGLPGEVFAEGEVDLRADGNLHWSAEAGAAGAGTFLKRHRASPAFARTGRARSDRYADPGFAAVPREGDPDLTPRPESAAAAPGVPLPADWPDPRGGGAGQPGHPGAIPPGTSAWPIGVRGRLDVFGRARDDRSAPGDHAASLADFRHPAVPPPARRAAIVAGYPAFDAPLAQFALEKAGYRVDRFEKVWLPVSDYPRYEVVVVTGDLPRAKMEPNRFSAADLDALRPWLAAGGTLLAMRGNAGQLFSSEEGKPFWQGLAGQVDRAAPYAPRLISPGHPWLRHLDPEAAYPWMSDRNAAPIGLAPGRGENLIGDPSGKSLLARIPTGRGAVISLGWSVAASLPEGRRPATVEMEAAYEAQYRVLEAILSGAGRPGGK